MGSRAGLEDMEKLKLLTLTGLELRLLDRPAIPTELPRIFTAMIANLKLIP
jgi:hypothetical protein